MISRLALRKRRLKGLRMCRLYGVEPNPRNVGRNGATPVMCSCFMCGNPRRRWKGAERLTLAERKARLDDGWE